MENIHVITTTHIFFLFWCISIFISPYSFVVIGHHSPVIHLHVAYKSIMKFFIDSYCWVLYFIITVLGKSHTYTQYHGGIYSHELVFIISTYRKFSLKSLMQGCLYRLHKSCRPTKILSLHAYPIKSFIKTRIKILFRVYSKCWLVEILKSNCWRWKSMSFLRSYEILWLIINIFEYCWK